MDQAPVVAAKEVTTTDPTFSIAIDKGTDPAAKGKLDAAKEARKVNEKREEMDSPIPQNLRDIYEKIENSDEPLARDAQGRFLPRDGEAKTEGDTDADAKGKPVESESDVLDGKPEIKEAPAEESKEEPADDDNLDVELVTKATRLGLDDDEIKGYTNAELKVAVKVLEKRNAANKVDKNATKSEEVVAELSKDKDEDAPNFDKMIEDGWGEEVVNTLKKAHEKTKFQTERADALDARLKAIEQKWEAEEQYRLATELDAWFSKRGEHYGEGAMTALADGSAQAKSREATWEKAKELALGAKAAGKRIPAWGTLLEQAHMLLNPKAVEQDAVRRVRTEQNKNKRVAPPVSPKSSTMPKKASSLQEAFNMAAAGLGIR